MSRSVGAKTIIFVIGVGTILLGHGATSQASGHDASSLNPSLNSRYIDFYYEKPELVEEYGPRTPADPSATKTSRVGFVIGMTRSLEKRPYPPPFAVFEKGDESDILILVALQDQIFDSVYRIRAVMATMSAWVRTLPPFQDNKSARLDGTFYDLAKALGFKEIIVSNGRALTYKVILK